MGYKLWKYVRTVGPYTFITTLKALIFTTMYNVNGIGYFFFCAVQVYTFTCVVHTHGCIFVLLCYLRLCCAQSRSDDGHVHATTLRPARAVAQASPTMSCIHLVTRNMHAHLCASLQTMRVCHICICAGEVHVARVMWFARMVCCRRSCLLFVVSKLRWRHHAIVPDLHLHCQRSHWVINIGVERI